MNKIESSTEKWIQKDKRIWVTARPNLPNPSKDAFLQARVSSITPQKIFINLREPCEQVTYQSQQRGINYEDCQKLTYGAHDVSDMVDLEQLNQPQLLYNLKRRYVVDAIFTYCGPTLVIINPYAFIQKLFNDQLLLQYQTYVFLDTLQYKTLPPHVFGLAAFCLWQLFENQRNQSIVISGQSGAGKTENTKYCLKFLASLGKNIGAIIRDKSLSKILSLKSAKTIRKDSKLVGIQDKILGCNEILQAFGNSKTIRNDNSSRFGKLILLIYGETQFDIRSAFIISYLLQKSRIVTVAEGERNYHIFYYFIKGATPQQKKQLYLNDPIEKYCYLNQSTVYQVPGVSDEKKYFELRNDFQNYFSKEEIDCIFKILSAVLNIGNLKFKKQLSKNNEQMAIPTNPQYLATVAKLFCAEYQAFQFCFQFKTRKLGVSVINSPLRYDEALALQNSFAKNLYQKIFFFLVTKLNEKIQLQKINLDENVKSFRKSIGLLDIFGFEVLGVNSLQQFFINFANQKLQQLYVSYIFKQQQNQFLKEGLKQFSHDIGFQDNKPIIDLFELFPLGLFHLINQSSELNKLDEELPQAIVKNHPKNPFVQIPRSKKGLFLVSHSCSPVTYNTSGFTGRNKDQFPQQLLDVIMKGNDEVLKRILAGDGKVQSKNRSASKKFLGSKFLNEMNKLTEQLYSSDCHFVRCIKPNSSKSPKLFNSQAVLQSLRYLGVLDSILIRKLGYIYRRPFKEFLKKFFEIEQYIFGFTKYIQGKSEEDFKQFSKSFILKYVPNELGNRQILLGHKKILIKQCALNHLQAMAKQKRKLRIQSVNKIKRAYLHSVFRGQVKRWLERIKIFKTYLMTIVAIIKEKIRIKKCKKIQKYVRKYLLQKRLQKIKQQATKSVNKIAAVYRMKKQRKIYLQTRARTIKVQAHIRFFLTMANYLKYKNCRDAALFIFQKGWQKLQTKKAIIIQKQWKGYLTRRKFKVVMQQIRRKLRLVRHRQYLMKIIFSHKFKKFQRILQRFTRPITKLQAIVRGKFSHRSYIVMKKCTILIQRAFKRHLRKKYYLIRLWEGYRKTLFSDQRLIIKQIGQLGVYSREVEGVKFYPETVGARIQLYPQQLMKRYGKGEIGRPNWQLNQPLQSTDKNIFQALIADYDIIGAQSYQGLWMKKYSQIKLELAKKNQYPIYVDLNEQFTTIITNRDRMYNFSAYQGEDCNQKVQIGASAERVSLSQSQGYLLKEGKVYVWGLNYQNWIDKSSELIIPVRQVSQLSKYDMVDISCRGNKRLFIQRNAKIHTYNYLPDSREYKLTILELSNRISIKTVALSYLFSIYLAHNGQLFAQGSNKKGQLGLGFASRKQVLIPEQIPYFIKNNKQIIESISVGLGHCVAKSKLGYIFTWGNNNFGQVGGRQQFSMTPQYLQCQQGKVKGLQAVAGLRNTFVLAENLRIMGIGTSSSFPTQKNAYYLQLDLLKQTSNTKNLMEIRISTKWVRELSILFVNAIDSSRCKPGTKSDVLLKYARMMAKEWIQPSKVYPEYHQWNDNILQLSDLRKFKFASQSKNTQKPKVNKAQGELQQLKALLDLRKTSALFKKAASQKIQQLIQRLKAKPQYLWTDQQKQLNQFIQQNQKALK